MMLFELAVTIGKLLSVKVLLGEEENEGKQRELLKTIHATLADVTLCFFTRSNILYKKTAAFFIWLLIHLVLPS